MRVLVTWADSRSPNLGVQVLARGMGELAKRAWGEGTVVDYQNYGPGDSEVSFGTKSILRDVASRQGPIKSKIEGYDLILDSGAGDSFADIYGLKRLSFMAYASWLAERHGVPLVMGPQTIGPFETRLGTRWARNSLARAGLVISRDAESAEYSKSLGRTVDCESSDVVFALPRFSQPKERDVILNISGLLWFGDDHVNSSRYRRTTGELVGRLEAEGRKVSLLAHVINQPSVVDDAAAIMDFSGADGREREILIPGSLDEARRMLSSAKLVFGARMHACLNAMSTGTPAVTWAYSRKFAPLMADIGWSYGVDIRTDPDPVGKSIAYAQGETEAAMVDDLAVVLRKADSRLADAVRTLKAFSAGN